MNMNESEKEKLISILKKEFGFWESTAIAFIEANGECVYCGENLYSNRLRYYSQNIDHVYPKSKYLNLANKQVNLALSCFKCNSLKKDRDLCPQTGDPLKLLQSDKESVLECIRSKLKDDIQWQKKNCEALNKILPWVKN